MKLSKIAFAVATLAIASGAAFAGQIGSSSVTLASEVIVTDVQIARAPSNVYTFAGDINAQTNLQRFQLQYTLAAGTWSSNVFPTVNAIVSLPPTATSMLKVNYVDAANAGQVTFPAGSTVDGFVTTDRKTLVFNVTIPVTAGAAGLLKSPAFTINATAGNLGLPATDPKDNAGVSGLFTVVGAVACPAPDKNIDISFKHFTTHNSNTDLIANATPDAEHLRAGSTNTARLLNFVQNLVFNFQPAANPSRTDAAFLNDRFTTTSGTSNFAGTPAPVFALASVNRHYLGNTKLTLRAAGQDLNYTNIYGNSDAAPGFTAAEFDGANDVGDLSAGEIELLAYRQQVTVPAAWPAGTILSGYNAAGVLVLAAPASTASQTVYTLNATTAAQAVDFAATVYLIATFPGGLPIPQTGGVPTVVTIAKDTVAGSPDRREQDNTCSGQLTGIGGGIKIDIRNYASRTKFPTGNFASYVRLINNSEFTSADVFAQMIYADGKYGPYGKLPTLAPRAVMNLSNAQLEAFLTTAAPVANPFGASTVYTSDQVAAPTYIGAVAGAGVQDANGTGDRIRFVSNTGATLRVQSYLLLPTGNLLDTTSAQGVDFENTAASPQNNRTPIGSEDAQSVSQDAVNGLAR
jgi:hypothetical protein